MHLDQVLSTRLAAPAPGARRGHFQSTARRLHGYTSSLRETEAAYIMQAKDGSKEPKDGSGKAEKVDRGEAEAVKLKKKDLARFREILTQRRKDILRNAQRTLSEDMTLDSDDLPDEMDLASTEYLHAFTFRLRGREKSYLTKIDKAIERIDNGTFGICEECGEPISPKRLEARLETTLCIRCKEDQEREEKAYG